MVQETSKMSSGRNLHQFSYLSIMEQSETPKPEFIFRRFFLRSWLTNLIFTTIFSATLFWIYLQYTSTLATRVTFLTNIAVLIICWTHTLLLLIFAIRRLGKRNIVAGICFIFHFLISFTIAYYLYIYLALFGWAYAMKGH